MDEASFVNPGGTASGANDIQSVATQTSEEMTEATTSKRNLRTKDFACLADTPYIMLPLLSINVSSQWCIVHCALYKDSFEAEEISISSIEKMGLGYIPCN